MSEKDHEISVSIEILKAFDVTSKVVTTDALLAQRAFSEAILEAGDDYILPIKRIINTSMRFESLFRRTADTDFQTA